MNKVEKYHRACLMTDFRRFRIILSTAAMLLSGVSACTPLGSDAELSLSASNPSENTIRFEAAQLGLEESSRFNEIIVYQTGDCEVPDCPIMWRVLLPDTSGPSTFIYGGIPTFGAQTIVPAQPLRPGASYLLVVGPSDPRFPYASGRLPFKIDSAGRLIRMD